MTFDPFDSGLKDRRVMIGAASAIYSLMLLTGTKIHHSPHTF